MKKVTITFGRMNPPTVGHEKLVSKLIAVAKQKSSEPRVYLSHSQNPRKDPLSYKQKIKFARSAFGRVVKPSGERNIVGIMKSLEKEGFTDVTLVVGSDRVSEFRTFLNKYNKKEFTFNTITVVSAGERDPDAEGVSGMSASKMRSLAKSGDEKSFSAGAPSNLSASEKKSLYKDVRKSMNIKEEKEKKIEDDEFDISDDELEKELAAMDMADLEPSSDDVAVAHHIFPEDEDELNGEDDEEDEDEEEEEEMDEARVLNFSQRQKIAMRMKRLAPRMKRLRAIRAKRMATPDRLTYRSRKAALNVLRRRAAGSRGAKYGSLSRAEKISIDRMLQNRYKGSLSKLVDRFAKRMLPKIRKKEIDRLKRARAPKNEAMDIRFEQFITEREDKDIGDRKGAQPAKYHTGLEVSTKKARDTQFQKQAKMSDSDPSAYKKAPGDSAKTKPSQYTKKYKQMYGEDARFENFIEENYSVSTNFPVAAPTSHVAPVSSPLLGSDEDPSDKESRKVDALLRLGLAPKKDLQKYRRALKDKDFALKNPELRGKLANLLDKLLKISTSDAAIYQKLRKAASDTKEDIERRADVKMVKVKLPDGRVVMRKDRAAIDIGKGKYEAIDPLGMKHEREREALKLRHAREKASAKVKAVRQANLKDEVDLEEKALEGLKKKAAKSGIPYATLKKVYDRGMAAWKTGHRPGATQQQWAYARVNSYITKGKTYHTADSDLREASSPAQQAAIAIAMKKAGKKPKDVKESSSALKRLQAFDKSRVAAGKPAIFDVNKKKEEPKKPVKESLDESFTAMISDTIYAKDFEEHRVQGGFSLHPSVVAETIRKEDGKYVIYSKDGSKKLGEYDSEEAAKKRLRQIEFFKRQG